jgi:hypothetical protein
MALQYEISVLETRVCIGAPISLKITLIVDCLLTPYYESCAMVFKGDKYFCKSEVKCLFLQSQGKWNALCNMILTAAPTAKLETIPSSLTFHIIYGNRVIMLLS